MIKNHLIRFQDHDMEVIMGNLLRIGVISAAVLVIFGGIKFLLTRNLGSEQFSVFKGEPTGLKNIEAIIKGAIALDSLSIVQLGLLMLIATPVARVAFSVIGFIIEKDYLYTIITIFVLLILIFSMSGGA